MRARSLLVAGAVGLLCSCLAGPDDDADDEAVAVASAPFVNGPCANACASVISGVCDWIGQCTDGDWPFIAVCGERALTCATAEIAALEGGVFGLEYCYRDCENLD